MHLQLDNYNLKAAESLPYFLSQLDSANLQGEELTTYMTLKAWDYFNNAESVGASYYEAWWDILMPMLWDEMNREGVELQRPTTYHTIKLLKEQPTLSFFDVLETSEKETAKEVIRQAYSKAVKSLSEFKAQHANAEWSTYKNSYIGHLIPNMKALSIPVKTGGNHDIVNAHSTTHGPSWRMIVSLEKTGVRTWATYPGGQSGNPGSKHYDDMLVRWTKGQYFEMLFLQNAESKNKRVMSTTTFKPTSK
jgi:penicillin amidase